MGNLDYCTPRSGVEKKTTEPHELVNRDAHVVNLLSHFGPLNKNSFELYFFLLIFGNPPQKFSQA